MTRTKKPNCKKLDLKDEVFAQEYVNNGNNATQAYRNSREKWQTLSKGVLWSEASRIKNKPEVYARIEALQRELQENLAKRNKVNLQTCYEMHMDTYYLAEENKDPRTMNQCTESISKLLGLITNKIEVKEIPYEEKLKQLK